MKTMLCPECDFKIEVRHTRFPHFACPRCQCEIRISRNYLLCVRLFGTSLAFLTCYLVGLRGVSLVLSGAILSLIMSGILTILGLVIAPPTIEKHIQDGSLGLR
jgi:hypothetical protein